MSRLRTGPTWRDEGPRRPDVYAVANLFDTFDSRRGKQLQVAIDRQPGTPNKAYGRKATIVTKDGLWA